MNEIARAVGFAPLFDPEMIDCGAFVDVELAGGALLDACGACGEPAADHPADAFGDEDEDCDA